MTPPAGLAGDGQALSLSDVCRVYESPAETVWAVRDVSLTVSAGTFVCLMGPSGSGKSTLLNLLAGLDSPTSGAIRVLEHEIEAMSDEARAAMRLHDVGVVFQDHLLIEEFTAVENVMLPLEASGVSAAAARQAAEDQLASVGLEGLGRRLPAQLSGGQRQRVGIARALVGGRRVLLADEPTGALDSGTSRELFELPRQLADAGTTVIVATHEAAAKAYADRTWSVTDGRVCTEVAV